MHACATPNTWGLILVMTGFLLQWPTLLNQLVFPVLVVMYLRLAKREERDDVRKFGTASRATRRRRRPGSHSPAVGRLDSPPTGSPNLKMC